MSLHILWNKNLKILIKSKTNMIRKIEETKTIKEIIKRAHNNNRKKKSKNKIIGNKFYIKNNAN
jgi:hypothetical protein